METKRFARGEVIFREGVFGGTMYEVKSGSVGIFAAYGTANEKKLTELDAGRIFGEMALIEVKPRSATAVALTEVEADEIGAADLEEYFDAKPEKLIEIMRGLTRRLRELTKDYNEVVAAIGDWDEATKQQEEKSSGLMGLIRKFAEKFAEANAAEAYYGNCMVNSYLI